MIRDDLPYLEALARRFPNRSAALAELAHLEAVLTLPKGTVHIVSDVHGEYKKLSHVIRNASGSLRVLVDEVFAGTSEEERRGILSLVYYSEQTWAHLEISSKPAAEQEAFFLSMLEKLLTLGRALTPSWSARAVERVFPHPYEEMFRELFSSRKRVDGDAYRRALVQPFLSRGKANELLRLVSRVVRNLSVYELIVAGDLGDRGPRLDKVIDVLAKQPKLAIAWGNHDVSWMGACLGQEALLCTVTRISLRYGRTQQLEEGYGIPLEPLEKLARDVYGDDPALKWKAKSALHGSEQGGRDPLVVARMQKAICILQLKLEGQAVARNPDFKMDDRRLLKAIDFEKKTVTINGTAHPLLDSFLPTLDPSDPEKLSVDEERCLKTLRNSFLASTIMWQQMQLVRAKGAMLLKRDNNLIFHGCLPVDDAGSFLSFKVDGPLVGGKAMFDAYDRVVHRAFREKRPRDLDLLWYLWTGPTSPLFGKDKMATFESHFVADEHAKHETKGAYFKLAHDPAFCRRVFSELGADPKTGFIVNGHVPVKLEKGETPLKGSGMAITIDGAFSEAYGDKGFTLILEAGRTALAEHHHFESVEDAVKGGADIVPKVTDLRVYETPRRVGESEAGDHIRREIQALEGLVLAFDENRVPES
ncbi:MAG: fructose-bisphosphatase class III [Deltaproteobacteria bacterium]|nr:fructose-bisphosphatase class III [Deltaproteobacteria bacterium]